MMISFALLVSKMSFRLSRILVLICLHHIYGQRRIKDGVDVTGDKGYMVYLVQAKSAVHHYNAWICGGSIVSRWYVLTSAACVEDVQSMYAISGMRNYVSYSNIFTNECLERTMKKVIFTCVPKEYVLDFGKIENWSFNDIAVVKVNSPFDFEGDSYEKFCDYKPDNIEINFDEQNEQVGTEVIVLGYGHTNFWRESTVNKDWNHSKMQYTSSKIYNVTKCKKFYNSPNLFNNIDKYMICTKGQSSIDEKGKSLNESSLLLRRINHENNRKMSSTENNNNITFNLNTRRHGICQNDHGGPLVAWIKGVETVIGVASVFRVDMNRSCIGPYLYTSTARNKIFIECIINDKMSRRSKVCNQPPSKMGFSFSRKYILWKEEEDHVVDNEEIRIRPQINMNFIGTG